MKFIDKIEKEINDEFGKLGDEDEGLLKDFDDDTDFSEVPEVKKLIKHLDKQIKSEKDQYRLVKLKKFAEFLKQKIKDDKSYRKKSTRRSENTQLKGCVNDFFNIQQWFQNNATAKNKKAYLSPSQIFYPKLEIKKAKETIYKAFQEFI